MLEIDPLTNQIVWQFGSSEIAGADFYSAIIGGAQRLASGNTLITLGTSGRVIGVTPDGRIVWDYHDPTPAHFQGAQLRGFTNLAALRMTRPEPIPFHRPSVGEGCRQRRIHARSRGRASVHLRSDAKLANHPTAFAEATSLLWLRMRT